MEGRNMFKKYWFIFMALAFTITAIVTGCETLQTVDATGGREYFPNTDGYIWNYRSTQTGTTEIGLVKYSFNGTTTVGGLTVQKYKGEAFLGTLANTSESLMRVTDTDVKTYGSTTSPTTEATNYFIFPLKIGNKWLISGTNEATVVAQENVSVPAGTYINCFKIRYPYGSSYTDMWLAKNVGIVKLLSYSTTGALTMELTSKSF